MDKRVLSLLLLTLLPISVYASMPLQPYAGVDIAKAYPKFAKGFGNEVFKKKPLFGNVYVGNRFAQNVGVEFGFNTPHQIKRSQMIMQNDTFLGIPEFFDETHESRIKMYNFHLSAVGFLPMSDQLEVLGSLGVSRTTVKFMSHPVPAFIGNPFYPLPSNPRFSTQYVRKTKYVPRVSLGLQYLVTKQAGIRGSVVWEHMKKFKLTAPSEYQIRLKNKISYSVGAFVTF